MDAYVSILCAFYRLRCYFVIKLNASGLDACCPNEPNINPVPMSLPHVTCSLMLEQQPRRPGMETRASENLSAFLDDGQGKYIVLAVR